MRLGILIVLIFANVVVLSQNLVEAKASVQKLEMNTSLSEIACDYYEGNLLFFQNKRVLKRNSKYYDLFRLDSSSLSLKNGTSNKEDLTKQITIETNYHEGPCFIDPVNKKIYITINSLDKSGMRVEKKRKVLDNNKLRLIEGDYENGVISNLKEFGYNNPTYNIGHATFSNQTNRLYFSSDMPGSIGESDIYFCNKTADGSWSQPVRLGGVINTSQDEFFPHVKNGILFYSSNAQDSLKEEKDLDIYYIKEEDILTRIPKPLKQLNTEFDEFGICFNKNINSFNGFFTSNRENTFSENDDIYSFSFSNVDVKTNYDLLVKLFMDDVLITEGKSYLVVDRINRMDTLSPNELGKFQFNSLIKGKPYKFIYKDSNSVKTYNIPENYKNGLITEIIKLKSEDKKDPTPKVSDRYDLLVNLFLNKNRITTGRAYLTDRKNRVVVKNIPLTEDGKYDLTDLKKRKKYKFVYSNGDLIESFDLPFNYESGLTEVTFHMNSELPIADSILAKNNKVQPKKPVVIDNNSKPKEVLAVQGLGNGGIKDSISFTKIDSYENVYFAFDSYQLDKVSHDKLDNLVRYYKSNSEIKYVLLNAYTDSRGNKAYNDRLSINRAKSCRKYLIKHGIPAEKIKFVGFGELNLTNDCADGVDCPGSKHSRNRRVEVSVLY